MDESIVLGIGMERPPRSSRKHTRQISRIPVRPVDHQSIAFAQDIVLGLSGLRLALQQVVCLASAIRVRYSHFVCSVKIAQRAMVVLAETEPAVFVAASVPA